MDILQEMEKDLKVIKILILKDLEQASHDRDKPCNIDYRSYNNNLGQEKVLEKYIKLLKNDSKK